MRILISLLLLTLSMPTWAQRQFDIEVIIFKRVVNPEATHESWPNKLPVVTMDHLGDYHDPGYLKAKGARLLASNQYQLTPQRLILNKHAGFKVLKHVAWRQGDEDRASAPIFHIYAGKDYSPDYHTDGRQRLAEDEDQQPVDQTMTNVDNKVTTTNKISSVNKTSQIKAKIVHKKPKPLYELNGKLQIYVQHYLYAETTLDLKEPSIRETRIEDSPLDQQATLDSSEHNNDSVQVGHLAEISPVITQEKFLKSYRMKQKRRMRSGEIHYLDNPLLGVIIQVRKVH